VFTEFMLAHWAGFDFSRPLEERRDNLARAIELRTALGIGRPKKKGRKGKARRVDPLISELERVERQMGITE
jgi:hypothetical protein